MADAEAVRRNSTRRRTASNKGRRVAKLTAVADLPSVDATRRTEILQTANIVIATSGLRSSLQQIADAAGILAGSLYHHFESKEAILVELTRRFHAALDLVAEQALSGLDSPDPCPIEEQIIALGCAIARCAVAHNGLGIVYALTNRCAEGEQECRQALAIDAKYTEGHLGLGLVYASQKRYLDAEREDKQALQQDPKSAPACSSLGDIYTSMEHYADAERTYKQAISLDPDYFPAYSGLTLVYSLTKRFAELTAEDWLGLTAMHLGAATTALRAAHPLLRESGGSVVLTCRRRTYPAPQPTVDSAHDQVR